MCRDDNAARGANPHRRRRDAACALTEEPVGAGHAVRITTRSESRRAAIEAAGGECWIATPDRIASLRYALENVTVAPAGFSGCAAGPGKSSRPCTRLAPCPSSPRRERSNTTVRRARLRSGGLRRSGSARTRRGPGRDHRRLQRDPLRTSVPTPPTSRHGARRRARRSARCWRSPRAARAGPAGRRACRRSRPRSCALRRQTSPFAARPAA